MKLIIEIDEDIYKARQHWVANRKRMVDKVDIAIANGIPLEDIKADIINIADGKQSIKVRSVLRILDRIGKESEVEEWQI